MKCHAIAITGVFCALLGIANDSRAEITIDYSHDLATDNFFGINDSGSRDGS